MFVLVFIYVFPFDGFLEILWHSYFGNRDHTDKDLLLQLLSYTILIFLTGLQINHFQELFSSRFKKTLSDVDEKSPIKDRESFYEFPIIFEKLLDMIEIHFYKLLFLITFSIFTTWVSNII